MITKNCDTILYFNINNFINIFKKVILDLIDYGAIDKDKLLNNVKNITNDKNLINWLCNIKFTL